VYTGYPRKTRTDAGTIFTSDTRKHLHESNGIFLQVSGVESLNSIGLGERIHSPLRRVYNKILMDYPHLHRSLILKLAIKATNDTIGIGDKEPLMLVFGCIPRFPITSSHLPEQADRMRALQVGMMEMNAAVATERISEAPRSQVPSATDRVLREGDEVMTNREKDKIWYSGFTVSQIRGKQVTVIDRLGEETNFSLHQVKLASPRGHVGPQEGAASVQLLNREGIHTPRHSIHYVTKKFRSEHHIEEKVPLFAFHISQTIKRNDPRNNSLGVQEAMRREIEGIVDKGTWAVTVSSEVPTGANILNGRFVAPCCV
jgi:hypothetical protein